MAEGYLLETDMEEDCPVSLSPSSYSTDDSSSSVSLSDLIVMQEVARHRRHQICDWMTFLLDVYIQPDNFFESMYNGLLMCCVANIVQSAAEKCGFYHTNAKIPIEPGPDVDWSLTCRYVEAVRQFCILYGSDPNLLVKTSDLIYVDRQYSLYSTAFELMKLGNRFGVTIPDCDLMATPLPSPSPE